mmetsp:Transcript_43430/g.105238  ORF Transcript_43430/g.105238 Transcript_43430/m.105238 type:complete len:1067 (-) Transcript_43430:39-3239(-)
MVNGPPSPTRGASLQERLERSRMHKKWLTDQQPHEDDHPAVSEAEQRQLGSRIQQIVQTNQDRKKKSPVVSPGFTTPVPSPSSHLESSRGSRSSLGNHRVVAMPSNYHTRNGGRSLTSSYHSRSGAVSPLASGHKHLQEGKGEKQDPIEASSKVATTTISSAAKVTSLSPPPTSSSVSASFLHWQQREKRDLAGKKTPSSTPRQHQHQQRQQASPTSSFAYQFSQQYVVKTGSKKQPIKVDASNEDDDDDQMSYGSHSLSSVSRVSSSTHSSTARSWAGAKPNAGQNFRPSHPTYQFTKQQQTSSPASHPYQQRSMPYSQQSCRGGVSNNLKKKQTNSALLQQGVPAINRDGTTNFKQLLKPVHDRDAKDDGSHQQMAYGAVIETPKKASVSNLHAMFNSQGSSEPIMPMNSKDPRIRNSLPAALSLPQLQGQHQQQNHQNSCAGSSNPRYSPGNVSATTSWTGRRLSDKKQSDQPATSQKNGGVLDEKVATAATANVVNTPIYETGVTLHEEKDGVVAKDSNQRNGDSLPSLFQHRYIGASSRESVVASWREHVHETKETPSKESYLLDQPTETNSNETMKGTALDSFKQPQVDDEPPSDVPVQRSSPSVKPWEVDTKNSVVQSWEARKSKDRHSTTSSENDDQSSAVSPTSSIKSHNVEDEVPIHNSSVTEDDVKNKSSDQDELLVAESVSAQDPSLDKDKHSLQKQTVSGTTGECIEEKKSGGLSVDPDDLDKILDDAILDHLALAKSGGSNGSGTNYDGVEEDLLLGSSHSGRITSDSFREAPHSQSRTGLEQSGSEELSLYTTDERSASASGFGSSLFDPFQNSQDSDSVFKKVGVTNVERVNNSMSTPMTPLGGSLARYPRLSPSPKDCDKYRSTYFGDEVTTPRAGLTLETKSDTKTADFSQPTASDVATKQDSGPPIVPSSAAKQEKQEQLSFDDTDQWLNKDPDFSSTNDKNPSPSSVGKDGISDVPTRSTSGPGMKGASVGQDLFTSSKAEVAVAETRQDVFDPFEDVIESPSGFFSPEHDPFNPFSGLDWPLKQTSNPEVEDIDDSLTDKNRMEI